MTYHSIRSFILLHLMAADTVAMVRGGVIFAKYVNPITGEVTRFAAGPGTYFHVLMLEELKRRQRLDEKRKDD